MSIFNYAIYKMDLKREAMGYTPMPNRDQYMWWDLEDLLREPPQSWKDRSETVPDLKAVKIDAQRRRKSKIVGVSEEYNLPIATAARMIKTYIGYHPSYGAYLCQLGPYNSEGFWHGKDKKVGAAVGRFGYFVLRAQRASEEELHKSLLKNISQYKELYNVDLQPEDFVLNMRGPSQESVDDPERKTGKNVFVIPPVVMDQNNPVYRQVFNLDNPDPEANGKGPMVANADATKIHLSKSGYEKFLRAFFGDKYESAIQEIAQRKRMDPEVVKRTILSDDKMLSEIYSVTLNKYNDAKAKGEVEQTTQKLPPPFLDSSLNHRCGKGAIEYTKVPTSERLIYQFELTKEILSYIERGIDDPDQIAQSLNESPSRVAYNDRKKAQNKVRAEKNPPERPLALIHFTGDEVQRHIDIIESHKEKMGEGASYKEAKDSIDALIKNTFAEKDPVTGETVVNPVTGKPKAAFGYDDMLTAYQVAMLYFSSVPRDKETGAAAGTPNAVAFNPPPNLHNHTMHDLAESKAKPELTKEERLAEPEELEKEIGALPEAGKELKELTEVEQPIQEGEDPLAGFGLEDDINVAPNLDEQRIKEEEEQKKKQQDAEDLENIMGKTIKNLIKVAAELDLEGKEQASEEIHKIIRKYQKRIF